MSTPRGGAQALEAWAKHHIDGYYSNCNIKNMTTSWRNGLAFCALIHRFRPDLIKYDELDPNDVHGNCSLAFEIAERQFGIPPLLDAEDMVAMEVPDRLSVLTYVAQFHNAFKNLGIKSKRPMASHNLETSTTTDKKISSSIANKRGHHGLDIEDEALNEARKKLSKNSSSSVMLRSSATCSVCSNPVYITERILFNKKLFHRSCFRCFNCQQILNPQTADISSDGLLLFCSENACFLELQNRSREASKQNSNVNVNNTKINSVLSGEEVVVGAQVINQKVEIEKEEIKKRGKEDFRLSNVSALRKSFENGQVEKPASPTAENNLKKIGETAQTQKSQESSKIDSTESRSHRSSSIVDDASDILLIKPPPAAAPEKASSPDSQVIPVPQLESEPSPSSDVLKLEPNSSLISEIKQREEEEILKRNTTVNAGTRISSQVQSSVSGSGLEVKTAHEMPNLYHESVLPIAQRIERNAAAANAKANVEEDKKNTFMSGMLVDKIKVEKVEPEIIKNVVESETATSENITTGKLIEAEVKVKVEVEDISTVTVVENEEIVGSSEPPDEVEIPKPVVVIKSEPLSSPTASLTPEKQLSPTPSPSPRRKSPAPSATSTNSAMSFSESTTGAPSPSPRRVKSKPPRPAPPSQTSLSSLSSRGGRGAVPSAKELWKKDNYYPAELNPFESEEDIGTNSPTTANANVSVPGNPFEDEDDDDEAERRPPAPSPCSPKPSPRIRSGRNQVNSITTKSRSHSRSRSRSRSRSPGRNSHPVPTPTPRSTQSSANASTTVKQEPKPYNPFEDEDDDEDVENQIPVGDGDDSGTFLQSPQKEDTTNSETSSIASGSISGPIPKLRQSVSRNSVLEVGSGGGTYKKSSKSKRAPLPPPHAFTPPTPSNKSSENTTPSVTPPKSPRSILKQSPTENGSPGGGRKKVIPASPDLLKGLKTKSGQQKKKRRAPPPRRRVEPLPEEAIKTEMDDLLVKERELERQGITLESNIRRLMQQEAIKETDQEGEGEEGEAENDANQQQLDEMMVQLWNIVNEKNDILRRQTELEYLRRGHRLEEMQAELEFKLRVLMDTPVNERQEDYEQVEQTLLDELLKLVDERNDVVEWLDYHRKQDREEDAIVTNTLTTYSNSLERQKQNSPVALLPPSPADSEKTKSSKAKIKAKEKDKQKKKEKAEKAEKERENEKEKAEKEKVKESGEKQEKEKKSKIKTLLFGKKKNKSVKSSKDGREEGGQMHDSSASTTENDDNCCSTVVVTLPNPILKN